MYFKIDMHIRSSYEDTSSEYNALNSWVKYHSKEYSPLVDIFTGQSRNRIVCSECKNASEVFEPWLMLKPVVPKITTPISFTDCMNATFIPETMEDYQCDKCNKRTLATLETAITRTPPITIIAFKRFNNLGRKIRGLINWNIDELDLRPWMAFDSSPFTRHQKLPIYETYAVIEHNGSMQGGHYHMYSRESKNNWVEYDDTGISDVSPERVVSADSYIVFLISKEVRDAEIGRMEKIINVLRNNRGKE
jgi:ubiquitin C-terminal hydrolase